MSTISASTTSTTAYTVTADTTGALVLQTGATPTTALTIDASQNITTANRFAKASMPAGSVLQVVNATFSNQINTSSATYIDTGLTASITPTSSTSKIMCFVDMVGVGKDTNNAYVGFKLLRGATVIVTFELQAGWTNSSASIDIGSCSTNYLDSPATTSATTYKVQYSNVTAVGNAYAQISGPTSTITLMEIAA
jgi:hypothetical protein